MPAGMGGCDEGRVVDVVYGEINPAGALATSASTSLLQQPAFQCSDIGTDGEASQEASCETRQSSLGRDVQPQRALSRWLCGTPEP